MWKEGWYQSARLKSANVTLVIAYCWLDIFVYCQSSTWNCVPVINLHTPPNSQKEEEDFSHNQKEPEQRFNTAVWQYMHVNYGSEFLEGSLKTIHLFIVRVVLFHFNVLIIHIPFLMRSSDCVEPFPCSPKFKWTLLGGMQDCRYPGQSDFKGKYYLFSKHIVAFYNTTLTKLSNYVP